MKTFKYIFISSIILFLIMVLVHFVYELLPFNIIAAIFPVNESIFQHMKMIVTSFIIYYIFIFFFNKKRKFNNISLTLFVSCFTTIIFFLIIYLPIYFTYGENLIFTLILLFISIVLGQSWSYNFLLKDSCPILNIISIILIIITMIIGSYFTFNPLHNEIFWDPMHKTYKRVIK